MQAATAFFAEQTAAATSPFATMTAHVAFGGGLFYGVQKFFEEIEKKLSADTKLTIAVWLLNLHPESAIHTFRSTFLKIFERTFGAKHLSWHCFCRSSAFSAITGLLIFVAAFPIIKYSYTSQPYSDLPTPSGLVLFALCICAIIGNLIPDYLSLWKTRFLITVSLQTPNNLVNILLFFVDCFLSMGFAMLAVLIGGEIIFRFAALTTAQGLFFWVVPAFVGRIWLLAYGGSGLFLRFARRLDIGFAWFNRCFDIENHPVQSIGLVAGTFLAIAYWLLAAISLIP